MSIWIDKDEKTHPAPIKAVEWNKLVDLVNKKKSKSQVIKEIDSLYALMKQASANLDFETAIKLRDEINELKKYKD